jgi:6-pyruvoyltetrahydropterin/6-carboxytetrahydropterin synthase
LPYLEVANILERFVRRHARTPRRSNVHEVSIEMEFSSAHALRGYRGKCENTHGHNYKVEIHVRGEKLDHIGLLVDFRELKAATRQVVEYLDHKDINTLPPFDVELNPSAENLAAYFFYEVGRQINDSRIHVYKVRVWETSTCSATYYEPEKS